MSKKKKNKKKAKSYYDYAFAGKSKKEEKKSKKKDSYYKDPKLKTVKASLDKKEAKANKKILRTPIDIPKEFIKNRMKCNHVAEPITVEEYKKMTPNYAAFTPMLDTMVEVFGEDNVAICSSCYDVLVDASQIKPADLKKAQAVLYAAANSTVSYKRMKSDEIKSIAKLRVDLADWDKVMDRFEEVLETITIADDVERGKVSADDLAKLNRSSGAYTT